MIRQRIRWFPAEIAECHGNVALPNIDLAPPSTGFVPSTVGIDIPCPVACIRRRATETQCIAARHMYVTAEPQCGGVWMRRQMRIPW